MASDLLSVAVAFQPDAAENKSRRVYDERARAFVTQLNNISQSQWQKGADTQQDVLAVCAAHGILWAPLTFLDTQPRGELDSLRLRPPPPHRSLRAPRPRDISTGRRLVEQAGAMAGDIRTCPDAVCWKRI
jgi:hypothetical protein